MLTTHAFGWNIFRQYFKIESGEEQKLLLLEGQEKQFKVPQLRIQTTTVGSVGRNLPPLQMSLNSGLVAVCTVPSVSI